MSNSTVCLILGFMAFVGIFFVGDAGYKATCLVCAYISINSLCICSAIENKGK